MKFINFAKIWGIYILKKQGPHLKKYKFPIIGEYTICINDLWGLDGPDSLIHSSSKASLKINLNVQVYVYLFPVLQETCKPLNVDKSHYPSCSTALCFSPVVTSYVLSLLSYENVNFRRKGKRLVCLYRIATTGTDYLLNSFILYAFIHLLFNSFDH